MISFAIRKTAETRPVAIVGDGAIARHDVGEGRMIPLVILNASDRPDITEWIKIHQYSGPGDVLATWGMPTLRKDAVSLMLSFQRPVELDFAIVFELQQNHSVLVEGILSSKGLYIQAGVEGDRIKDTLGQPRVIVEIAPTDFAPRWEQICVGYLARNARDEGMDRKTAKRAATEGYAMLKELAATRPFRN